jgi:hypothetical protein
MDFGIAETGIARGSPPGTTTEVLRFGIPFAEIRVVSALATVAAEEAAAVEAQEEAPAEGGLVDIASILGAPALTIVRSSL